MRFLLDQGLPRTAVNLLALAGVSAQHVGELSMATASDQQILEWAAKSQSIVVTLDSDFHQLLAASRARFPSVVRIRVQGLKGVELADLLLQVLKSAAIELSTGAVVSVTPNRIRVRLLPIGK